MTKPTRESDEAVGPGFGSSVAVTKLITSDELKEKLDRGDDFKLVMALGGWYFRAVHISGSINVSTPGGSGRASRSRR